LATTLWQSSLAKLKLWLINQQTIPALADDLISGLCSWYDSPSSIPTMLASTWQDDQQEIG